MIAFTSPLESGPTITLTPAARRALNEFVAPVGVPPESSWILWNRTGEPAAVSWSFIWSTARKAPSLRRGPSVAYVPLIAISTPIGYVTAPVVPRGRVATYASRSEEHTSELQSLAYLVC